jgi:hypothetical protein
VSARLGPAIATPGSISKAAHAFAIVILVIQSVAIVVSVPDLFEKLGDASRKCGRRHGEI